MSASNWNFEIAAREAKGDLVLSDPLRKWTEVSIDTRTLKSGEIFFALKGRNQDGHDYLWEAFRRGASGAVIKRDFFKQVREKLFRERALFHNLIPVADPEESLAVLSAAYRSECSAIGVGVTGSVGKTSSKEFIYFLLSQKYPVLKSFGNLNNHLGLPLTLFQLQPEHQYCVAELGANHSGEIRRLAGLLRPQIGLITGISPAHLEGFGSLNKIYGAKLELADALVRNKGTLVLPDRDPELIYRARKRKIPILLYGDKKNSDFRLTALECKDGWVQFEVNGRWSFRFPGYASFQAENGLAALATVFACGISPSELPEIWKEVGVSKGRFEICHLQNGTLLVNDCYNANPYSFEKALEAFAALEGRGWKILVLGDMLELGTESAYHHRALGDKIQDYNFQALFAIGDWTRETSLVCEREGNPPLALHFENKGMLSHFLASFLKPGDQVLFKASRSIRLEEVIATLSQGNASKVLNKS